MDRKLLHVYRNTPLGRETLLQSAWFCQQVKCRLVVFVPDQAQFLLYLQRGVVTVGLDSSYLRDPDTAREHVREICADCPLEVEFTEPSGSTAPSLPNLEGTFHFMACPRSMSELSSKIHLGHLGPRVRSIVKAAPFPVLIPTPVYKAWNTLVACYGGSENSIRATVRAERLCAEAKLPLAIFTWADRASRKSFEEPLERAGLMEPIRSGKIEWIFCDSGSLESALFRLPREALLVAGAYGQGGLREAFFGGKLETLQSEIPNNLLIFGPAALEKVALKPGA